VHFSSKILKKTVFKTVKPCCAGVCHAATLCRAPERAACAAPSRPRRTHAETACDRRVYVRAVLASASRADSEEVPRPRSRAGHAPRLCARDANPPCHTRHRTTAVMGVFPSLRRQAAAPALKPLSVALA
jgi:hypothetical protein